VSAGPAAAGPPAVAAHRGGALLWPENSLTAFRGAIGLGVDLIELDVHLSRDDEVVVLHDPTLDRTTNGRGPVRAHAWAELAPLAVAGTAGDGVPRLGDVLALLRGTGVGLLLEIKTAAGGERYPGIEERCLALLEAAGLTGRTTVMAFEWATLERLRALAPAVRLTGLLSGRGAERLGGVGAAAERLRALGANDLGIERTLLGPDAVAAARARGLTIGVWTVNDPAELARALASGVDYVTTDRPDLALRLRGAR
jgi:glycerophosphoryl diester phosphodiesterase